MEKAFAYLRVSGKDQIQGDGFPRQEAAIRAYAKAHDMRIVKVFREEGVSGTKDMGDRPAFTEMLLAMLGNGVRTIICEKLDRLARDLMVQETILGDLRKRGIALVSVAEPDLCSDDPTRVLLRHFMGAVSQYEKTMIVLKLRGARQRTKAKEGRCEGRKPYGHYDGEQAVLERMQTLREGGMAVDTIAGTLNAEGVLSRSGKLWYGATVNKILKAGNALQSA
jgi:DNA invertase Pin-like site-specific DNA recombinase